MKDFVVNFFEQLIRYWQGLTPAARIGVSSYCIVVILFVGMLSMRSHRHIEVAPPLLKPNPTPMVAAPIDKIVIDSVDQATYADAFDDDTTTVVNKSKVTEQEMVRVTNDWLQPQVMQLGHQIKDIKKTIEK